MLNNTHAACVGGHLTTRALADAATAAGFVPRPDDSRNRGEITPRVSPISIPGVRYAAGMLQDIHAAGVGGHLTTQSLAGAATATAFVTKPEWLRLPKPGHLCPYSGLSRTTLFQLAKAGLIKSISLRKRGAARGIRLIGYDSLMAYLRGLEATQCDEGGAA